MSHDIKNTVIRDNIENNRLIELSGAIRRVINTREFQRLRHIRQTGLTSLIFPTAEHSRFSHSLGVFATAKQAYRQLQGRAVDLGLATHGIKFDGYLENDFCIAALCHDIGHSAFSHVLERILLPDKMTNHEACTRAILEDNSKVSKVIDDVADVDSVLNLLKHSHANKALSDLISSPFDVDRCDYVLRDGYMAGVEYGSYDLKWLFHAIKVELNEDNRPVLLLDGPRGLDALRQFLSARRYLHRQVYYHPAIRGSEILLKAIFERMQDLGEIASTVKLAPACLHALMRREKLTLNNFLRTTDVEVLYMVRNFSEAHEDKTLKYLAHLFVRRKVPKCILDSARASAPLSQQYRIQEHDSEEASQGTLALMGFETVPVSNVTDEIREFVANALKNLGKPAEAAKYLVKFDVASFISTPPTDLLFSFGDEKFPLERVSSDCIGFDIKSLLETFRIARLFVPRQCVVAARDHLNSRFRYN